MFYVTFKGNLNGLLPILHSIVVCALNVARLTKNRSVRQKYVEEFKKYKMEMELEI
jgi:hypothetical protein